MNDTSNTRPTVTIKKYANRRLYNTATSSYVTLEDLSAMVKEGVEFNVYDAKTSEDITRSVLTQIIVEEEGKSGQQNLLPIGFLRQLISFYGDSMQWMVPKYLDHSMQALSQNQDQIRSYFQSTFGGIFPFGSTLEEMSKQNLAMFDRAMRMFSTPGENMDLSMFSIPTPGAAPSNAANPLWNMASCFMNAMGNAPTATSTSSCSTSTSSNTANCNKTNAPSTTEASSVTTNTPVSCPVSKPAAVAPTPAPAPAPAPAAAAVTPAPSTDNVTSLASVQPAAPTPMPNVKSATASTNAAADDMQQKIANLQRQLADLAKNRA